MPGTGNPVTTVQPRWLTRMTVEFLPGFPISSPRRSR
jgi:hypothetical protein